MAMAIGGATLALFLFTYLRIKENRFRVVMRYVFANDLKAFSPEGKKYLKKQSKKLIIRVLVQITWFLESSDLCKDFAYLYAFEHNPLVTVVLILTIVLPFALFHRNVNSSVKDSSGSLCYPSFGPIHSFMIFYGFTMNLVEELARAYATVQVATYENTLQFLVIFYEILNFGDTVTWYQAVNPAFSLAMIMNTLGPELGDYLYPIIAKHSKEAEAYVVEWN